MLTLTATLLTMLQHSAALPPAQQERVVAEARKIMGVPYVLGGRLRDRDGDGAGDAADGIDCQGLLFFAFQALSECGWRSWSVLPTVSVQGELGLPIGAPIGAAQLADHMRALEKGDVLWFLDPTRNPAEASIGELDGVAQWVWHTGLYAGDGKAIIGDHFAGAVVEEELVPYVKLHYAGVLVTRMKDGPAPTPPAKCRKHAPMKPPPPRTAPKR